MMHQSCFLLLALLTFGIQTVFGNCGGENQEVISPCSSCKDRCGQSSGNGVTVACSCDGQCMVYGDCCYDFVRQCPHEYFEGTYNFGPEGHRQYGSDCGYWRGIGNVLTVSVCPDGTPCDRSSDVTDINQAIPILDTETGVHYINAKCAVCNGVVTGKAWQLQVKCEGLGERRDSVISSQDELSRWLASGQCYFVFNIPQLEFAEKSSLRRNCKPAQFLCAESCKGSEVEKNCRQSIYQSYALEPFPASGTVYKNPYCAICMNKSHNLTCEQYIPTISPGPTTTMGTSSTASAQPPTYGSTPFPPDSSTTPRGGRPGPTGQPGQPGPNFRAFSFTVLLDFNSQSGVTVGRPCQPGYVRVRGESTCRPISCPTGFIKVDITCYPSTINMTILSILNFTNGIIANKGRLYLQEHSHSMLETFLFQLQNDIHDIYGYRRINVSLGSGSMIKVIINAKAEPEVLNVVSILEIIFHVQENELDDPDVLKQEAGYLTMTLNSILLRNIHQAEIDLANVEVTSNNTVMFSGATEEFVGCSWVSYSKGEYTLDNNRTVRILATNETLLLGIYSKVGQVIFICLNDTTISTKLEYIEFPTAATGTLGLVTLVLTTLSIVCLLIRLILQPCVPSYRSFPGWLQFHLCLSLCLAFLSLLANGVATLLESPYPLCVAVSVWMYWMFLSAFAWMLSIAFNTWNAFRPSSAFTKASEHNSHSIYRYVIFAWFVPLLLAAVALGLDFSSIEHQFRPDFGVRMCWINQPFALLIYFGIPIACCLLLSVVFYTLTVCSIRGGCSCKGGSASNAKISPISTQSKMRIYVGLFVVMGICWVVGFAAALIKLQHPYDSALWYVFIILNASQGIFIFIFFVCKKRTFKELRQTSKISGSSIPMLSTSNQGGTDSSNSR